MFDEARPVQPTQTTDSTDRVLVVDDDAAVGRAIQRVLRPLAVTFAQSAAGALARVAAGGRFQAIVCDVHMPAMTGMQFQREVRRIAPDLAERIVFVTGGAQTPEAAAFVASTASPCLAKPFESGELRAAVAAMARRPSR
jgi:CheY-like chemotaxis protein